MSDIDSDSFESDDAPAVEPIETTAVVVSKPAEAPNIGALNDEDKASVGHVLEKEIVDDSQQVMARYLRIGRNLFLVSKNHLYKQLGFDSFDAWRAQPDMNLSRATAYALMKVFEVFVDRLRIDPKKLEGADWSKLYSVAPFVTAENVDEYLEKVKTLSRTDLQREAAVARARLAGKTQDQAEAQVAVLDIVRDACPINCGAKCGLIDADHDAAIEAFKKWLGRFDALKAKVKSLWGKKIA